MIAQQMPFSMLINDGQGAREHFHIPKYQREYTWGKWQWDQLLTDILDNEPGYFMGSMICVNDAQALSVGDEIIYQMVDGQQRLTTLSLILMAVHARLALALPGYEPEEPEDLQDAQRLLDGIRAKLVKRKKDARPGEDGSISIGKNVYFLRVQPSAQNHNLDDYRHLLSELGLLENQLRHAYFGNRLMSRAYGYFFERIPSDVPNLSRLAQKIDQLMFVQITVNSQADAFTLFESLNNRGVPLSAMDIIKNKMLAQMEKKHAVDIDRSFDRWQDIIEAIPDPGEQERFLRHFYNAFKHKKEIKVDRVAKATRSQIIRIYETLINRDAALAFDELTKGAKLYGQLLRSDLVPDTIRASLIELGRIGSAPAYQALLYLFSLEDEQVEDDKFLGRVVDLMGRYFLRRNVTDIPPTRLIDQGLIDLVEACAGRIKAGEILTSSWFVDELMKHAKPASLKDFRDALEDDVYLTNSSMARYVLVQLDQMHHSREYQPDLWARDDRARFVWTVEHVLPQTEKLSDQWVEMIAGGDRKMAADLQNKWVHRLGNLTLSGYNSDLSTASFEKKQKLAKDRSVLGYKINIGYKNGLALNNLTFETDTGTVGLADAPFWNAEMIEARTKLMADMVVRANLLPGEELEHSSA